MDESGNQLAVFNRRGSRPFNREEAERLYMKNGQLFTVNERAAGSSGQIKYCSVLSVFICGRTIYSASCLIVNFPATGFSLLQS